MKERPILFKAEMVRAILAGTKTQTRRLFKGDVQTHPVVAGALCAALKPNDSRYDWWVNSRPEHPKHITKACPYGRVGDRLWVRETWAPIERVEDLVDGIRYAADDAFLPIADTKDAADRWVVAANNDHSGHWRPSIFMPRWASRITLEVTEVRVQRLQDISATDVAAEGVLPADYPNGTYVAEFGWETRVFRDLWSKINGADSWASNPWVWAVSFSCIGGVL